MKNPIYYSKKPDNTINGTAPASVYSEMIRHVMANDEFRQGLLDPIPLDDIADPRDVVVPALGPATATSDFVSGQIIYIKAVSPPPNNA